MSNINQDHFKVSFHQALSRPQDVDQEIFEFLLAKYPYSQPLHFAYLRKQTSDGSANDDYTKTLLYAPSASWLKEYVESPVEEHATAMNAADEAGILEEENTEVISDDVELEVSEEDDSLEKMIQVGVGAVDYFKAEKQTTESFEKTGDSTEEKENISLYNDILMPYSFRWWLHKTRLEYAESYQPFIDNFPKSSSTSMPAKSAGVALLDQQIKEHIFHLQSPEDKLSDEVKRRTIEFYPVKKLDEVIERFIREEPQIQPPAANDLNTENKARSSSEDQFSFVTETLANIYIEQGLYTKAIEVFKKLIVKFPEKKSYFAHRIEEVEDKF